MTNETQQQRDKAQSFTPVQQEILKAAGRGEWKTVYAYLQHLPMEHQDPLFNGQLLARATYQLTPRRVNHLLKTYPVDLEKTKAAIIYQMEKGQWSIIFSYLESLSEDQHDQLLNGKLLAKAISVRLEPELLKKLLINYPVNLELVRPEILPQAKKGRWSTVTLYLKSIPSDQHDLELNGKIIAEAIGVPLKRQSIVNLLKNYPADLDRVKPAILCQAKRKNWGTVFTYLKTLTADQQDRDLNGKLLAIAIEQPLHEDSIRYFLTHFPVDISDKIKDSFVSRAVDKRDWKTVFAYLDSVPVNKDDQGIYQRLLAAAITQRRPQTVIATLTEKAYLKESAIERLQEENSSTEKKSLESEQSSTVPDSLPVAVAVANTSAKVPATLSRASSITLAQLREALGHYVSSSLLVSVFTPELNALRALADGSETSFSYGQVKKSIESCQGKIGAKAYRGTLFESTNPSISQQKTGTDKVIACLSSMFATTTVPSAPPAQVEVKSVANTQVC